MKPSCLPGGNHVHNAWDVINIWNFFVMDVVFLDSHNGDVEYPLDASMKENLKSLEKVLSKRPVFAPPKKKVHGDCPKEEVLAVCVQVWDAPDFFQGTHTLVPSLKLGFNVCIVPKIVRYARP